jgi:hypothetical protein
MSAVARWTTCILVATTGCFAIGEELRLELDHTIRLPNVVIDQQPARVHTQGLYVDQTHIYVTGRLEREPRRPLFLRFERADVNKFEVLDLSIRDVGPAGGELDHPGGFDFDGQRFWIPVARSTPQGPSVILRMMREPDRPFTEWPVAPAFQVHDHIGAVAYEKASHRLYGANWDTKQIYIWTTDGIQTAAIPQHQWLKEMPGWALAVQDWKSAGGAMVNTPGALIAGGIDKSVPHDASTSRAVVELYLPSSRERLARVEFPTVEGFGGPVTNEGMCLYDRWLVLLPGDIGRDAHVYFFKRGASF